MLDEIYKVSSTIKHSRSTDDVWEAVVEEFHETKSEVCDENVENIIEESIDLCISSFDHAYVNAIKLDVEDPEQYLRDIVTRKLNKWITKYSDK